MKIKEDLHSFSPFVFTWHGTKKGPDRLYPWSDALHHPQKNGFTSFFSYEKKRQLDLTNLVAPRSHIHLRVAHHAVYQA